MAVDTGKVILGSKETIRNLKLGKGKLVIVAKNAPDEIMEDVKYYAKLSNIPVYIYNGSSVKLGAVCGKPFTVAALLIKDPGDSPILEMVG